jgi:hypothetical protein
LYGVADIGGTAAVEGFTVTVDGFTVDRDGLRWTETVLR